MPTLKRYRSESFPEKLKQKYRKLDEISYDYLTDLERQFLKAQVEEARRRRERLDLKSSDRA